MSRTYDFTDEPPSRALALGLGWFSIGLGVAELAAPRALARLIGVVPDDNTLAVLRAFGARELGAGAAILAQPDRPAWMWSRVAGDAVDLASLASVTRMPETDRTRALLAIAAVAGVTALDIICARRLAEDGREEASWERLSDRQAARPRARRQRSRVTEAVTVNAPLDRVQQRWESGESMPESLRRLTELSHEGSGRTIVQFRPAPGGRGTEVRVDLEWQPQGAIATVLATLMGPDPSGQLRQDLRRFKQLVETGEVLLSEGPSLWRPGQPAENPRDIRDAAGLGAS